LKNNNDVAFLTFKAQDHFILKGRNKI